MNTKSNNRHRKETEKAKNILNTHDNDQKILYELYKERVQILLGEFKIKHENEVSTIDYILGLVRQFLAISATGYIGLLVVPKEFLNNISTAKNILVVTMVVCFILIIYFLRLKIILSKKFSEIFDSRVKVIDKINSREEHCIKFSQEMKREIRKIEEAEEGSRGETLKK